MASTYNKNPMFIDPRKNLRIKPRTMKLKTEDLKLVAEQIIDFKSFTVNGYL